MNRLDDVDFKSVLAFERTESDCWDILISHARRYRRAQTDEQLLHLHAQLGRDQEALAEIACQVDEWYAFDFLSMMFTSVSALRATIEEMLNHATFD